MPKALVLGGTQFIGPAVVHRLEQADWEVACFHRGRTPPPLPGVREIFGDRRDTGALRRALEPGYDAVVDTSAYVTEDLKPILSLLEGRAGRYLFLSTVSVYADMVRFPVEEDYPYFDGDPSKNATAAYAYGKVRCERALRSSGLPFTILRPAFVYGPWNTLYREAFYFDLIDQGKPVMAGSTGSFLTQILHVDDLAAAILACLQTEAASGRIFNATDLAVTQRQALESLVDAVSPGRGVEEGPADYAPWGIRRHLCVCTSSLRSVTGWRPTVSFGEGMADAYKWYAAHAPERRPFWETHAFKASGGR
jgi:nucleoside-diphosphate-sugar epimerase